MKKQFLLTALIIMSLGIVGISAQTPWGFGLPDGSIAPDFTTVDIDGDTINLYSILDSGKPVLLHIGGIRCGNSINLRYSYALTDLDHYFPLDLQVIWVEGDPETDFGDIIGVGTYNTTTDFTQNAYYPIIDEGGPEIAETYGVDIPNTFAATYIICPNRVLRFYTFPNGIQINTTASELLQIALDCPDNPTSGTDGYAAYLFDHGVTCPQTLPLDILLHNLGSDTLTQCQITVSEIGGGIVAQTNWTGSIPTYQNEMIHIGDYDYTGGVSKDLQYNINVPNDVNPGNNSQVVHIDPSLTTDFSEIYLDIQLDWSPGAVSWKFVRDDGTLIVAHSYYTNPPTPSSAFFTHSFGFDPLSCYDFIIHDNGGNGICCGGAVDGWYRLRNPDGTIIYEATGQNAVFETNTHRFKTGTLVGNDIIRSVEDHLSVFPNPAGDMLTIRFDATTDARYEILNTSGQVVMSGITEAGVIDRAIVIAALPAGIYLCSIILPDGHRKAVRFVHSE